MSQGHASHLPSDLDGWNTIVRYYEACLRQHGATPCGADWPNGVDLATRFGVMLELLAEGGERPSLLDLGCGPGLALDYLAATGGVDRIEYFGVDLSDVMVSVARERWPQQKFSCRNIITEPLAEQSVDVVIMNGVLTERAALSTETMTALAESLVVAAFRVARIGIAFNVMNAHVDWQRNDLFHWPFDALAHFLKREVGLNYSFRADYGLYEYACLVRRRPRQSPPPKAENWWTR